MENNQYNIDEKKYLIKIWVTIKVSYSSTTKLNK